MAIVSVLVSKLFNQKRSSKFTVPGKDSFIVEATISHNHQDDAEPTENPVEEGVPITDHIDLKPSELTLTVVQSNTPLSLLASAQGLATGLAGTAARRVGGTFAGTAATVGAGVLTNLAINGGSNPAKTAYEYFLDLRNKRVPFQVVTGMRSYENMVITSLTATREAKTGNILSATIKLKQIRVVKSQKVFVANASVNAAGRDKLGKKPGDELDGRRQSLLFQAAGKAKDVLKGFGG